MRNYYISLVVAVLSILAGISAQGAMSTTGRLFDDPAVIAGEYSAFCQDRDGFLWIGTNRGLIRFDGNGYDVYRHDDAVEGSLSDNRILGMICDSKGRIWVATANGLNLYMPGTDSFKIIPLPSEKFYGYVIGVAEQPDGTVTFVVSGVGLYVVDDSSGSPVAVRYTSLALSMAKEFNSIACCRNGKIFLGSRDGTVYCMAPNGRVKSIKVSDGAYIQSIAVEEDDNVLVSALSSLYRIDSRTEEYSPVSIDGKVSVTGLSNSSSGRVYVATSGDGLWEVATKSEAAVKCTDLYCPFLNLSDAKLGAVYSSPDGNLWLGISLIHK